jgi:hypothetical protein
MKRLLIPLFVALAAGLAYHQFFYPPTLLRRATMQALADFSSAVATRDRANVSAVLERTLPETAKIHMEVGFFALTQPQTQPVTQDFDKAAFIRFIDTVLYPLDDYHYQPELEEFTLSEDRSHADVVFTSMEWADGKSYFGGLAINMRFTSTTECKGHVAFREGKPLLEEASCSVRMHSVPKPEEAQKIQQNPEALRQLLR